MLQPPIQNVSAAADAAAVPASDVREPVTAPQAPAQRVVPQLRIPVAMPTQAGTPQQAVNAQFPGVDPGVRLWRVGDPKDTRQSIYDAVLQATAKMPPIVSKQYTLQLADPHYAEDDPDFNANDDKQAMLERRSLSRRLRGTWQLLDNASGQLVSERKATIANVPAILRDGTFLRTGTRYAMGYQQRLRPGIYTRFKNSGEPESHVNAQARSGRSHRYVLEPETGLFSVHVEHAKIPLVPLLDVLGVSREQVEATWGKELTDKNYAKSDPKALGKYYERFVPKFEQTPEDRSDPERMKEKVREAIGKIEIDEAVVEKTLGRPSRNLDADLILRATGKSLRLLQGKEDADDRDNLGFASYHSAADILAERFTNDYGKFRRELLYKAARKGDLNSVPSGALDKYINAAIFRSGLGQTVEDVNPAEIAAAARKITRFGEGGLPDTQSAPAEARDVSPSQFGFIDPILTPESLRVGIDGVLSRNTFLGSDNKLYREMLDGKTGQKIFRSPDQLMRSSVAIGAAPLPGFEMVIAGGKVKMGRTGTADYRLPSMDDVFSDTSSLVPMKSAMYGQRGGMGSRMSITGDSNVLIHRADGSGYFGPIRDYPWMDGDLSLSIDKKTHELCWKPVIQKLTYKNEKRLLRVTAKSGRTFVATADHSCVTLDDFGCLRKVNTEDLQKYGPIPSAPMFPCVETYDAPWVVPAGNKHNAHPSVSFKLDRDLGWIIGLYVAEGYGNYRKTSPDVLSVTFANINVEIQRRSQAFFESHGVAASIATGRPDGLKDRIVTNWKQLAKKLKEDFGDGAYNKRLPGWVMFAPREFREGILAGYMDGDGVVAACADRSVRMGGGSRSRLLRDALATLCGTLDIATTVSETWVDTGPGGSRVKQFSFNIRKEHIDRVPEFTYPVKQLKADAAEWSGKKSGDWLPLFAAARCLFRRFTKRGTTAYGRVDDHVLGSLSRREVREVFGEHTNWITRGWADSAVWWDRVFKLQPVEAEPEEYVYDLNLADNVFWVDGLFVHNSGQAISLVNPEAPLVQSGVSGDGDESYEERFGEMMGAMRAKERGRVVEVRPTHVTLKYAGGREEKMYLDNNRPGARKTIYHQDPVVEMGQEVEPGQLIARSNHTDAKGVTALGTNARMALMAWDDAWEDNVVVSRSFADRTKIQQAYRYGVEPGSKEAVAKRDYLQLFGSRYKDTQLKTIGDDGVIKPGTVVRENDPLILAVRQRDTAQTRVHKQNKMDWSDTSIRWDHAHEGVVTDVVRGKHGVQVVVKTAKPLEDGDKLAGRFGNKGVIVIKEDNEMPHDESGQPLDAVVSPLAIPSRGNSSFPIEMILGKIAKKTGVPYKIKDFTGEDMREFAEQEALRHGVKDVETVTDPVTGRKIPNVLVGNSFMMVLHHMAASKTSGRGLGKYTGTDAPARGPEEGAQAKRYSGQQMWAGMSHGAYNMSAEATLLRGTRNTDYWSAFMAGESVGEPKIPVQYESFLNRLRGAGINPVRSGAKTRLMALIDSDVRDLAGDRVVTSSDTVDLDNDMRPIKNGLFDPKLFGDGDRFAAIKLSEPMPNPVFEEPLRRILGVTEKDFREVVAGRKQLEGYGTGSQGLKKKLESMDLDVEIRKAREAIGGTRKVARDDAVRRLKYLKGLKETDTNPVDLMLSRVPVLPPRLRPISKMANKQGVIVHDANYLYRELMEADKVLDELKGVSDDTGDERLAVYDNYKAVVGLTEPNNKELKQRKVKGLLKRIVGDSPKSGEVQRRLLSGNVDTIGRGVIAPDTSLDMDSFGLPERLAFKMYEPYLVRNMVSTGIPRVQAMEHLKAQDDVARRALLVEIDKRPVTVSRAPILHKYGDIALKPQLVKGDTIRLNPAVYGPMGADNDGNCVDYDEVIVLDLSVSALYHAGSEFLASMQEVVSMRLTEDELVTIQSGTDIRRVVQLKIGQFPRVGEPSEPKPGQLMYDVPPGVSVLSYQHDTGEPVWSPVTTFTVDKRHKVVRVKTNRKREVKVSDNESLAVLDETTLTLERVKPVGSEGRFMATIKKIPIEGAGGDFDAGWLQAAMIANGWSSASQLVGYAHNCLQAREKVVELVKRYWGDNFAHTEYADSGEHANKFSSSVKRHLTGPSVRGKCDDIVHPDIQKYRDRQEHWIKPRTGDTPWAKNVRPALFKRIPPKLFLEWGEEAWLGVLCGYLENDGTLARVEKAKGGEQARIAINTSSPYLYEGMQHMLRMLGVRYSTNNKGATDASHPGYTLTLSNIDIDELILGSKLRFYTPAAQEWLRWRTEVAARGKASDSIDVVPVPHVVRAELRELTPNNELRPIIAEAGKQRSLGRMRAKRLAAAVDVSQASDMLKRWIQLANNDDIHWDRVKTVEEVGVMDVYDIGVPETKVFAINNGLVIWDTVNLNLPHSRKAVHEALTRMLPSKMLMSVKDFDKAVFMPTQDLMFGLNRASRPARTDVQTRYFVSLADARAAYARGDIDLDTPVKIGTK